MKVRYKAKRYKADDDNAEHFKAKGHYHNETGPGILHKTETWWELGGTTVYVEKKK